MHLVSLIAACFVPIPTVFYWVKINGFHNLILGRKVRLEKIGVVLAG